MQPSDRLTPKEIQVAMLVWEGQTNREIASVIGTTEQVIKNYLRNTFDKLGVWSRLELALYVAAHGGAGWHTPANLLPHPASLAGETSPTLQPTTQPTRACADKDDRESTRLQHRSRVSPGLISA